MPVYNANPGRISGVQNAPTQQFSSIGNASSSPLQVVGSSNLYGQASGNLANYATPTATPNATYNPQPSGVSGDLGGTGVLGASSYGPQQQQYYYSDGSVAGAGGGGAAAARASADTMAYYDNMLGQLNGQFGQLDNTQNIGLNNIANSFNLSSNRLNEQKGMAERNYKLSGERNTQNYVNTRGGIMNRTSSQANALQRLLGMNGSGNSSAAYEQAPYAAAKAGTMDLTSAQQTYGQNGQALDMSWQDAQRQYSNGFEDLNLDRQQKESGLKQSIASTRQSLLSRIADATGQKTIAGGGSYAQAQAAMNPYQQQVNDLLSQITQLGNQYQSPIALRTGNVEFKAPSLSQYSMGGGQAINAPGAQGEVNPLFSTLLAPRERDEYGLMG